MVKRKEDLAANVQTAKEFGWFGWGKKPAIWEAMARNILRDDLGEFEDSTGFTYDVDEPTRDRLIAHARQDAAMAFYAARAAHTAAAKARFWSTLSCILLSITLFKVW